MASKNGKVLTASVDGGRVGAWPSNGELPPVERLQIRGCIAYLAILTLLFLPALVGLAQHAAHRELNSHILLVPFVCGYLLYLRRGRAPTRYRKSVPATVAAAVVGMAALTAGVRWSGDLSRNDYLAVMAFAFVSLVVAGGFQFLGAEWMAAHVFPVGFLLLLAPLPDAAVNWLENASALASAEATAVYFRIWGVAVVRQGTVFELPGITLEVAQECSGIRSSFVLLLTSLLTSHLFLKTRWRQIVLVAFVIPLGILRNGFRILVIAWLCLNVGPEMIDSPIHHRGGPIFFALSLIPFFAVLWRLWRQEQTVVSRK